MNVYDFDRTLFPGDSSMHFWAFCKSKYPKIWLHFPGGISKLFVYNLKMCNWAQLMEKFFKFLKYVPNPYETIEEFWDEKKDKIYPWYDEMHKADDIIISASPHFLIDPIASRLGVRCIATDMDINTYKINGVDCSGEEKLRRFLVEYPNEEIDCFYSDSYNDTPLAKYAKKAYMITKKGEIVDWDFKKGEKKYKPRKTKNKKAD